jgi:glycosyltransferase involved in cell wall biosynthesis
VWRAAQGHDIVHINSALAPTVTVLRAGVLALAGRLRGCRVIVHAHGGNIESYLTTPVTRAVMRIAMAPSSIVVACWTAGQEALLTALAPAKVRLVRNAVDVHRFAPSTAPLPSEGRPPRLLYVGLLTPRKGVLDLIEASRALQDEGVVHELRLLGGTPDEGPAAAHPVLEAARGHATLLGTRSPGEMPQEYAQADVFCLPSWWEAMPLSVLEAMAAGLPVVASDVGEVRHIVGDGATGLVVPSRSPQSLASALRKLLADPVGARRMGCAGRARAEEQFSSDVMADALDEVYREVLGRSR